MGFKIAIIDTNDVRFEEMNRTYSNLKKEKISDTVDDFVTIKDVKDNDEFMNTIIEEITPDNNNYALHTCNVQYINNELYQMCHILLTEQSYEKIKEDSISYNGIASYLSDTKLKVYGKAVLFKIDSDGKNNQLNSIKLDEIINIFISKFIHKGVILDVNNNKSLDEFTFIFNPIDWINEKEANNYRFHEIIFLDKVLMLFVNINEKTDTNEIATKFFGKPLHGKVIVAMREHYVDINDTDRTYCDLDKSTFTKMIKLINSNKDTKDFKLDANTLNDTGNLTNFHRLLDKKLC